MYTNQTNTGDQRPRRRARRGPGVGRGGERPLRSVVRAAGGARAGKLFFKKEKINANVYVCGKREGDVI